MSKINAPCWGCTRRRDEDGYNCHSDCPDYKEYREKLDAEADLIRHKKAEDQLLTDTRIRSVEKATKMKPKQTAGRG